LEVNLNNDILNTNCGVPLIFIVNKSDSPFPKYADKSEFILKHIRKIAISYGASIIYTSTKKKYNIKVLYDYIFYTLFNCDLVYKSNIHDKTSYFIPSGYDRFSLLKSSDINHDIDADYFEMIKVEEKMKTLDEIMEKEIICEKVDDFLKKVKDRTYKSRKSILKAGLIFGQQKKETEEKTKKKEDTKGTTPRLSKFDAFLKKNEGEQEKQEKPDMTKEERTKKTREKIMNKLNLRKNKNETNNK
jgi:hypothetical protein